LFDGFEPMTDHTNRYWKDK